MRKIGTQDIFAAMRIIKASGMKEELKPVIEKAARGDFALEDLGIEAVLTVIEAISGTSAEKAFYDFLSGPFEMTPGEVAVLPWDELLENLKQFAEVSNLQGFFKSVYGLMRSKSLT